MGIPPSKSHPWDSPFEILSIVSSSHLKCKVFLPRVPINGVPPSKPHLRVSSPRASGVPRPQLLPDRSRRAATVPVAAYMAANTRPTPGGLKTPKGGNAAAPGSTGNHPLDHSSVFATASVGRGDWASEVLQNVVGGGVEETAASASVTSTQASSAAPAPPQALSAEEQLKLLLLQKKRLFHSNRCLELKNLPEGVTEQVSNCGTIKMAKDVKPLTVRSLSALDIWEMKNWIQKVGSDQQK